VGLTFLAPPEAFCIVHALTLLFGAISGHCKQPTQYLWIFTIFKKMVVFQTSRGNVVVFWN
jgi:hypothetical protein